MTIKHNNAAYHLIDDEIHPIIHHPECGWDTDHRGNGKAYEFTSFTRRACSTNTKYPTFRRRTINEEKDGVITLELSFQIVSGDGFYIGVFGKDEDGETDETFVLRQKHGRVHAGDYYLFESDNAWHYLKLEVDLDGKTGKTYLDGKYLAKVPLSGKGRSVCCFEYGYGEKDLGEAVLHIDLKMYKNYLFNDWVISRFDGIIPEEYKVKIKGEGKVYRRIYSNLQRHSCYDVTAKAGSRVNITRKFDKTGGSVGFEMKYLLPEEGGKIAVSMMSGSKKAVTVFDEGTAICHGENILRSHSKNVFQTLRIEADTDNSKVLVRLNGKKTEEFSFDNAAKYIDGIKIEYETAFDSTMLFADLKAFPIPDEPCDYVSAPVIPKKKADHVIGMNICSLWRTGNHFGWDCITPFEENKPYLGYYDEGNPETADWELKWMAEHGLDFQLYCWFCTEPNMPNIRNSLANQLEDGHMLAKYSDKVKFALLWETMNSWCPSNVEDFKKYTLPHIVDHYLSDDRYMEIDGYAVFSIYTPETFERKVGGKDTAREMINLLRKAAIDCGYKGMIVLACAGNNMYDYKSVGFDGTHEYNLGTQGAELEYTIERNTNNREITNTHSVPTVSMGYNKLPWYGDRFPVLDPKDMTSALTWVREELQKDLPKGSWQSRLVMLSTWNEYGEGTFMCPANVHGFGYLDSLREVFTENAPHEDIIPTKEQLERINILYPRDRQLLASTERIDKGYDKMPPLKRWEFKTQEDLEAWDYFGDVKVEIRDGKLYGKSTATEGLSVYMIPKDNSMFPINSDKVGLLRVRARVEKPGHKGCAIHYYFKTEPDEWYTKMHPLHTLTKPDKIVSLELNPFHSNTMTHYPWHSTIYGFKMHPIYAAGEFEIESVELLKAPEMKVFYIDGKICELARSCYTQEGVNYIPFDVKSDLRFLPNLFFMWDKNSKTLTLKTDKTAVFTKDSDIVVIDGNKVKMQRPLAFIDGLFDIEAELLSDILGMDIVFGEEEVRLNSK